MPILTRMIFVMNELIFQLSDGRKILICLSALKKMEKYRQYNSIDTEAGGILIGRILCDSNDFIIDDVSEPMISDIRKRYSFKRNSNEHQTYFNSKWTSLNKHCFYLGEWHTHPEKSPIPSRVDLNDWNRIAKLDFEPDHLFFLILGTEKIGAWCVERNQFKLNFLGSAVIDERN